jgi:hypothetical protein
MLLSNPLMILVVLFALLGLIFLLITIAALKKRKLLRMSLNLVSALLMLSLCALFGTIIIGIQGYQALTKEELAATIKVEPIGEQKFMAHISLPGDGQRSFALAGDQLYLDAHILKWKPVANFFGLHTSYELDRVAGRYAVLQDEQTKLRTVYSLAKDKPVDLFALRQRFTMLNPLLDAEYGSATYINSNSHKEFQVLVSTTGLLIRKAEKEPAK